ncbi:hypothetical protein HPB47_013756 [Ixodes persulcatus]|uniref:Uncharacterized protein n=1 Tax=Ixodes persulcatus TaxID=34615 RepID=A0AC60QZJ3_IXOPE|nr:hypothetical protein HPB47_013756 [Ixodes persulcatus]
MQKTREPVFTDCKETTASTKSLPAETPRRQLRAEGKPPGGRVSSANGCPVEEGVHEPRAARARDARARLGGSQVPDNVRSLSLPVADRGSDRTGRLRHTSNGLQRISQSGLATGGSLSLPASLGTGVPSPQPPLHGQKETGLR